MAEAEFSPEQLAEQIKALKVSDLLLSTVSTLGQLAYVKVDARQLDEALRIVQETAADIRAGEFVAKPGYVCRNCAYKPICPAHEEALSAT